MTSSDYFRLSQDWKLRAEQLPEYELTNLIQMLQNVLKEKRRKRGVNVG